MPITKEFTVLIEDQPGMLGKLCRALADREVNILALQSFPIRGKFVTRFIVDNPKTAKTVLDSERLTYTEAEIVRTKILHGPGEIARLASRWGKPRSISTTHIAAWSPVRMRLCLSAGRGSRQGGPNS